MRILDLALSLGGRFEGAPDIDLTGAAPLDSATETQLSFVANPRNAAAATSRAGCLLVSPDFVEAAGRAVIRVGEPRLAFARAVALLHPRPRPTPGVHSTAVVDPTAQVGAGASLGPYCVVGPGSRIGRDCVLHGQVSVYDGVVLGDRCVVHAGSVLGADGFGFVPAGDHYQKAPQLGGVEIGDDVEIGANCTIDRGTLVATKIGSGTKIDNLVHVAHNCVVGCHVVIAAQTGIAGGAMIGDWVVIGGQVGIGDNVRIGDRAVIGGASAIPTSKLVPAGETVWGVPARPLKQYLKQLAHVGRVEELRRQVRRLQEQMDADLRSPVPAENVLASRRRSAPSRIRGDECRRLENGAG